MTIVASDLVSSENSQGTVKLLLTRPVGALENFIEQICNINFVSFDYRGDDSLFGVFFIGDCFRYQGWEHP